MRAWATRPRSDQERHRHHAGGHPERPADDRQEVRPPLRRASPAGPRGRPPGRRGRPAAGRGRRPRRPRRRGGPGSGASWASATRTAAGSSAAARARATAERRRAARPARAVPRRVRARRPHPPGPHRCLLHPLRQSYTAAKTDCGDECITQLLGCAGEGISESVTDASGYHGAAGRPLASAARGDGGGPQRHAQGADPAHRAGGARHLRGGPARRPGRRALPERLAGPGHPRAGRAAAGAARRAG